jgi:hypothetical protein
MDDQLCRRFFREPELTFHRRYEALRAVFLEERPLAEIAERYGYKLTSFKTMVSAFRTQCQRGQKPPFLCSTAVADQRASGAAKIDTAPTCPPSRISNF